MSVSLQEIAHRPKFTQAFNTRARQPKAKVIGLIYWVVYKLSKLLDKRTSTALCVILSLLSNLDILLQINFDRVTEDSEGEKELDSKLKFLYLLNMTLYRRRKMNILKLTAFTFCLWPILLQAKGLMKFSTIENSPYSTISEQVMRIAYSRLGVDMSVSSFPAERALFTANRGTIDGELYRIKNVQLKYKNLIMIPVAIGRLEGLAITRDKNLSITKWEDLSHNQVCYRRGVKFAEVGLSNIKARAVNTNKQLFIMIKEKRCDVIVIARITSIPMVMDFIETQKIQLYQSVLQTYPLFHYQHKKNEHLVPKLIKELNKMQQEGLIEEIRSAYIATITN